MTSTLENEPLSRLEMERAWRLVVARAMGEGFYCGVSALQNHAATLYEMARSRDFTPYDACVFQDFAAGFSLAARHLHHSGEPGERFVSEAVVNRPLSQLEQRRMAAGLRKLGPALALLAVGLDRGYPMTQRSMRAFDRLRDACNEARAAVEADERVL